MSNLLEGQLSWNMLLAYTQSSYLAEANCTRLTLVVFCTLHTGPTAYLNCKPVRTSHLFLGTTRAAPYSIDTRTQMMTSAFRSNTHKFRKLHRRQPPSAKMDVTSRKCPTKNESIMVLSAPPVHSEASGPF